MGKIGATWRGPEEKRLWNSVLYGSNTADSRMYHRNNRANCDSGGPPCRTARLRQAALTADASNPYFCAFRGWWSHNTKHTLMTATCFVVTIVCVHVEMYLCVYVYVYVHVFVYV